MFYRAIQYLANQKGKRVVVKENAQKTAATPPT
jgi:hypothetical protein